MNSVNAGELSSQAEIIFKKYSPAIYQIQSISVQSDKKYSIGSASKIRPVAPVVVL